MNVNLPQSLKMRLAPGIFRAYAASLRLDARASTAPDRTPRIFACLHRDILSAILYVAPVRPVLLISRSEDGDILERILGPERYGYARGSTGSEGGEAFRTLMAGLREGRDVGVAVDGPRGPFGKIHEGVLMLSRLSGAPIVPLSVVSAHHVKLRNWDRTLVPLPFSRVRVRGLDPIIVPRTADADILAETGARLRARLLGDGDPS